MKKNNKIFTFAIVLLIVIIAILMISFLNKPKEGSLEKITYNQITEKIENKDSFILIISQSTCSHCATYKPKVKVIAEKYGLDIYYTDINLEKNKDTLLKELNLSGATPTTLFIQDGKETSILNRLEGDFSSETIIEEFRKMGFINE